MNGVDELLDQLKELGATLSPNGDRLIVRAGAQPVPAGLIRQIHRTKAEVLQAISSAKVEARFWQHRLTVLTHDCQKNNESSTRARARASWGLTERTEKCRWHLTGRRQCVVMVGSFAEPRREPAAAARSERSLARRVAASMGASRQVRGRRPVVRALPRPSVNVGASIERVFGRSTVRTKPGLKGRYSLAETCLVTSSRHRK
jgi:hypothetical protein